MTFTEEPTVKNIRDYIKEKLAASSPTSDEILDALVELIRDKLKK